MAATISKKFSLINLRRSNIWQANDTTEGPKNPTKTGPAPAGSANSFNIERNEVAVSFPKIAIADQVSVAQVNRGCTVFVNFFGRQAPNVNEANVILIIKTLAKSSAMSNPIFLATTVRTAERHAVALNVNMVESENGFGGGTGTMSSTTTFASCSLASFEELPVNFLTAKTENAVE